MATVLHSTTVQSILLSNKLTQFIKTYSIVDLIFKQILLFQDFFYQFICFDINFYPCSVFQNGIFFFLISLNQDLLEPQIDKAVHCFAWSSNLQITLGVHPFLLPRNNMKEFMKDL